MTKISIQQLAAKTNHGYSFDRFGQKGWEGAIETLRAHGLTDIQIEAWMLSKYTRWAADFGAGAFGHGEKWGNLNGAKVIEDCIAKSPKFTAPKELAELVEYMD